MRSFRLTITARGLWEILDVKRRRVANLGRERAHELDDVLAKVFDRIQALPESCPRDRYRGRLSKKRRRVIVGKTGYILRYRLYLEAELLEVFSLRHQKQRAPR